MLDKFKEQLDEQLGLLETKVERAYDIATKDEIEQLAQGLKETALEIQKITSKNTAGDEYELLKKIVEQINLEAEELTKHLVMIFRKQEKQEALYNISHLYSKTTDGIIGDVEQLKEMCVAQARHCVADIDSIFDEVWQLYSTELEELELDDYDKIIIEVNREITKCKNIVYEFHSQFTYKIEEQIINAIDKMVKKLIEIKEKDAEHEDIVRIKGGVTNSQDGKITLSGIIASKTEVVFDTPKRVDSDTIWD